MKNTERTDWLIDSDEISDSRNASGNRASRAKYEAAPKDDLATVLHRMQRGLPLTEDQQRLAKYLA